jgi:nitroimidazol reductase NimA-like FMN-containing flavoprotein (pyridoxamine 5'-phosphate oxidase superfamily)
MASYSVVICESSVRGRIDRLTAPGASQEAGSVSVMNARDVDEAARAVVDANRYMTLGTADASGRPWVSPVWYAADRYREFLWVSSPGARHSLNLAERDELSIVIFDSTVRPGDGVAVYMTGTAGQLEGAELERGVELFSRASVADAAPAWGVDDVSGSAQLRLYRALVAECFLGRSDERERVSASYRTSAPDGPI